MLKNYMFRKRNYDCENANVIPKKMITISESESDFSHTRLWGYGNQENVSNDVHPSTQKKATTNTHIAPWRPHFATFGSNLGRHAKLASISTSNIAPSRPYHIIVAAPACRPTQPAFFLAPAPPRLPRAARNAAE